MTEAELCREVQCGRQQSTGVHRNNEQSVVSPRLPLAGDILRQHVSSWQLSMGEIL